MRQTAQGRFGLLPANRIPATASLCATILVISIAGTLGDRFVGFGTSTLNYQLGALLNLELWRLVTYPFVVSGFLGLLITLVVMWLFGGWFESTYGSRDYLRFFFAASIGAGLLAIPFTWLVNLVMPFFDPGLAEGPNAVFDAMLMAMALTLPNANILFGFVLPMRAKTAIWILIGLHIVSGIYSGAATLGVSLGGLAMGYLLVTGYWRPSRLRDLLKMHQLRRRRRGLYVVPPKDETLH